MHYGTLKTIRVLRGVLLFNQRKRRHEMAINKRTFLLPNIKFLHPPNINILYVLMNIISSHSLIISEERHEYDPHPHLMMTIISFDGREGERGDEE